MPSFTAGVPNLQVSGPVVEMQITISNAVEQQLREEGQTIPPPITVAAMIDTGATGTAIKEGLATQLGLHPVGIQHINTPASENVPCNEYLIRLRFPNNVIAEATAIEAPLQGQHIQCLIGRNLLAHAVFVYIGYNNQFTLSF